VPAATGTPSYPVITHGLGTTALMVFVQDTAALNQWVPVAFECCDAAGVASSTQVRLTFNQPVTAGRFTYMIVSAAPAGSAEVTALKTALFGGATRTAPPVCSLYLPANRTMTSSADWFMDTQWAVDADPDGIWVPGAQPAGGYMLVPVTGRYDVRFHAEMGGVAPAKMAAKVYRNGQSPNTNVIAAATQSTASGWNEPNHMDAWSNDRLLTAGDKLWFACWADVANVVLYANGSNWGGGSTQLRTTATLTWIGPN
jgi:hypothetical protein